MGFFTRHLKRLGLAALNLVSAELAEVSHELGRTGRLATRNVLEWAVVFALSFWFVGTLTFAAIAGLSLVWPPWASALVVSAVYLVGAMIVAAIARRGLRSLESPVATVRRRIDGHVEFWRDELEALAPVGSKGGGSKGSSARRSRDGEERSRATDAERRAAHEEEERRRIAWGEGRESADFDDIPDQKW